MTGICEDCIHYFEPTDYCDLNLFEADEKFMDWNENLIDIEECLFFEPIGGRW